MPAFARPSPRRLLLGLVVGGVLVALVAATQPYPRRQEGSVYCLPLVGPRLTLANDLPDSTRARVLAHELVHVRQCRALGFWAVLRMQWSPAARLQLEAEASCAEARLAWSQGARADHTFERLVDELVYGMPRGWAPLPDAARAAAAAACPDLARRASQPAAARTIARRQLTTA